MSKGQTLGFGVWDQDVNSSTDPPHSITKGLHPDPSPKPKDMNINRPEGVSPKLSPNTAP